MSLSNQVDGGLYIHFHYQKKPRPNPNTSEPSTLSSSTSDLCIPYSTGPIYTASSAATSEENPHAANTYANYQLALYLHYNDHEGGMVYQVEATEGGLIAKHRNVKHVSRPGVELKYMAYVPKSKRKRVDDTARTLDNALQYFRERTSMKWILMIVVLLMRDNVVKAKNLQSVKRDIGAWADLAHTYKQWDDESDREGM